jgi:hypothetical protein
MKSQKILTEKTLADNHALAARNTTAGRAFLTIVAGAVTSYYPSLGIAAGMAGALDIYWANFSERRRNLFLQTVKEERSDSCLPVDAEYIESEAFFDLVIKAVEATDRTGCDEKIRLFAKILTGAVVPQDRTSHSPGTYLSLISDLSEEELGLAKVLFAKSQSWKRFEGDTDEKRSLVFELPKSAWEALSDSCPFLTEEDLPFYLTRLQRTGLIKTYGATTAMDYPNGEQYVFTKTFSKIVAYVNENWEKLGSDEHETRSTNL